MYLGIDLGTSSVKALLIDDTQVVIGSATAPLEVLRPHAGWSEQDPAALVKEIAAAPKEPLAATFRPYLSGERTPHNNALVAGSFHGMQAGVERVELTQAVLERVAFAIRDAADALLSTGTELASTLAVGGGTRSPIWMQFLANVLDQPIHLPKDGDLGAAFGAARLGMMEAEKARVDQVCLVPEVSKTFEPEPAMVAHYSERFAFCKSLYSRAN